MGFEITKCDTTEYNINYTTCEVSKGSWQSTWIFSTTFERLIVKQQAIILSKAVGTAGFIRKKPTTELFSYTNRMTWRQKQIVVPSKFSFFPFFLVPTLLFYRLFFNFLPRDSHMTKLIYQWQRWSSSLCVGVVLDAGLACMCRDAWQFPFSLTSSSY